MLGLCKFCIPHPSPSPHQRLFHLRRRDWISHPVSLPPSDQSVPMHVSLSVRLDLSVSWSYVSQVLPIPQISSPNPFSPFPPLFSRCVCVRTLCATQTRMHTQHARTHARGARTHVAGEVGGQQRKNEKEAYVPSRHTFGDLKKAVEVCCPKSGKDGLVAAPWLQRALAGVPAPSPRGGRRGRARGGKGAEGADLLERGSERRTEGAREPEQGRWVWLRTG